MNFITTELEELYDELSTDPKRGLRDTQVQKRLEKYGHNELPKLTTWFDQVKIILSPLMNWLILIYFIGGIILYLGSFISPDNANMSMITTTLVIVFINIFVAIFQQIRATKKLNALRELSAPTSIVLRNGKDPVTIPARELVPGDLVILKLGEKIPADCRVIDSANLEINEASLTGESIATMKNQGQPILCQEEEDIPIAERINMVYLGTYITRGNGQAIVVKTGMDTELGKIQEGLNSAGATKIPIREKMNYFGKFLGLTVVGFWLITLVFKIIITDDRSAENIMDILFISLNSALDIMPINIPLLVTVILITGVLFMAKEGVIIRNIAAVDSLGRVNVICSDKTGTLTKSQMTVKKVWTNNELYSILGLGYDPTVGVILEGDDDNLETAGDKIVENINDHPFLKEIIRIGYFNNNAKLINKTKKIGGKEVSLWDAQGNPTDASLITLHRKAFPEGYVDESMVIVYEYPFSSELKRMSKVLKERDSDAYHSYVKGASNIVLDLCTNVIMNSQVVPMQDSQKAEILKLTDEYAARGYRVISIANKRLLEVPNNLSCARPECEIGLTYAGFVCILDPPRERVDESVLTCYNAGIDVVMITGDAPSTARSIAEQINIVRDESDLAIMGRQIPEMIETADFDKVKVFARVSPADKEVIVNKYQRDGKIVAMTGDGVNDALALNLADCGIAMGIQGTDVAKESADMVISDDSFNSIVKGIYSGRGIFAKIRALVFFYIAINVFEGIVQFLLAIILGYPYFLNENFYYMWIWLSVTLHMFPGFILVFDKGNEDVMDNKPKGGEEILANNTFKLLLSYGALLAVSMVLVYFLCFGWNGADPIIPIYDGNYSGELGDFLYSSKDMSIEEYFQLYYPEPQDIGDFANNTFSTTKSFPVNPQLESFIELCTGLGIDPTIGNYFKMGKTLTMLMVVLFFSESILVLQIRRPNKNLLKSLWQDSSLIMLMVFTLLFGGFLAIMYIPRGQVLAAQNFGMNFAFMYLTAEDWLYAFLCTLPTILGIEIIKFIFKKQGKEL